MSIRFKTGPFVFPKTRNSGFYACCLHKVRAITPLYARQQLYNILLLLYNIFV